MFTSLVKKFVGSRNERVINQYQKVVTQINALEPRIQALSDDELKAKTPYFREQIAQGANLDDLLPETFAVVREVSVRTLGLRHFDVQLIGGMVLHNGKIAEMRMGEGKTLVATLPAYLNGLSGKGVHIVTVNDYLARRDSEWMGPIFEFLGFTVGLNLADMNEAEKQAAYAADVTYGTNNEFGFDYLRDNMVFSLDEKVQRPLPYAIIDEVDSILIDEARTPLIISGPAEGSSELYVKIDRLVPKLKCQKEESDPGDYTLDEKQKQAYLTEQGHQRVEELMVEAGLVNAGESLYSATNISLLHHLNAALRAHNLYHNDVDYVVKNNEIVIIDEHTDREMPGRRWSEGLHQAVEAKEKVDIQNENQTLASITFQNFFRMYDKLSGMTGTADTEAYELQQIYNLEVIVIPTNQPMIREDQPDQVYRTQREKFNAIVDDIKDCQKRGQPVLVGTASIEASEFLSNLIKKENVEHQVLNAKFQKQEAEIVAEAGRPGTVTIATNMAGRGTDIVLGGNLGAELSKLGDNATEAQQNALKADWQKRHDAVIAAGGLHIIGSERHESRRIDNQLRGRSGRQGDIGSARFYLSLEDRLMRIFASERVSALMQKLGMEEGVVLEHKWVNRIIENAQRKVEGYNFDVRKQLLEYDNVANDQRQVVYAQRNQLLEETDLSETVLSIYKSACEKIISQYIPPQSMEEQWDVAALQQYLASEFNLSLPLTEKMETDSSFTEVPLREFVESALIKAYQDKVSVIGEESARELEKNVMLQVLDHHWREHLVAMDHLRQGIHLRGYAQKDPRQEYKRESYTLFTEFLDNLKHDIVSILSNVEIKSPEEVEALEAQRKVASQHAMEYEHAAFNVASEPQENAPPHSVQPIRRETPKVGRNEPCHCGSGRKFKHCHGKA